MTSEPLVEMHRVSITRDRTTVLIDVNLRISRGERVAILGPNGSGKSSLIRTMTGELRCDTSVEGSYVKIRGEELWDLFDVRKAFGLVSGELQIDLRRDMKGMDAVLSGFFGSIGTNRSQTIEADMESRAQRALAQVGAEHLSERRISTLSMGEARRVIMARALVNDPEALILDEPMNSLDLTGKHIVREAMRSLARNGTTLILVTHDPSDLIPEIDRVVMMKGGRVFSDGGLDTLNAERLSGLYEIPVQLSKMKGRFIALS